MTEKPAPKDDPVERHDADAKTPDAAPPPEGKPKARRRPGYVIGPTTGDTDVQLES